MASGKKNYFRHSMNARNDHKLKTFMGMFGRNWREGYFYFFSLLELCGSDAQDGKVEHVFHIKTLRDTWGSSTKLAVEICEKLSQSELVLSTVCTQDAHNMRTTCAQHVQGVYKSCATHVTFSLPNLLNYTGQYAKNAPNKEIKEKKDKKEDSVAVVKAKAKKTELKPATSLFEVEPLQIEEENIEEVAVKILTALNSICFKSFRPTKFNLGFINARLNDGYEYEDFVTVIKFKHEEWANDPKMSAYIQPSTLFNGKMDQYIQQAQNALKPKIDPLEEFLFSVGVTPAQLRGEGEAS